MYKLKSFLIRKINFFFRFKKLYNIDSNYAVGFVKNKLFGLFEKLLLIPLLPILIPIIILIRLIRPLVLIRFGDLESEGIGHFSQPVEMYLSELDLGYHVNKKTIDLWYLDKKVCNRALLLKWSEHLNIWPRFIRPLHLLNQIIPGGKKNEIPYRRITDKSLPWQVIDYNNVLDRTEPHIKFSKSEKEICNSVLSNNGFDINKKFVCLNIRDSTYHNDNKLGAHRNFSVNEYSNAISYLNELGYQVVRLGAKVKQALQIKGPLIFDYATSGIRSEILDIYLISECEFYVGTGSGLDVVSTLFRKKQLYFNISEIGFMSWYTYNSILLIVKFKKDGKVLPFQSVFNNGYHKFTLNYQFENEKIKIIKNTDAEMRAAILEVHLKHNQLYKSSEDDDDYQEIFKSLFSEKDHKHYIRAKIGADFLKMNRSLLPL